MKRQLTVTALLLFFCFSSLLLGGTTGKIVGLVKDKISGEALIGVNILVEGTTLGATTDVDGSYLILNVPPGNYTLSFQYVGYQEVNISNVQVSVGFTTEISTSMQEATIEIGEAVQVVAEREFVRRDLTSSQAEVTASDIAALPVEQFEDVLQLQAGITRDENGGFHIRGGRSSEVAFWVDGVSVTDNFDGSNGVEIENDAVQSLQVISGTFNAEFGQAMSGIVNIVTKDGGQQLKGGFSAYVGDYISSNDQLFQNIDDVSSDIYSYKFNLSGPIPLLGKNNSFFVNFRKLYEDGYLYGQREVFPNGDPGDNAFVPMNSSDWETAQGKLTFQLTNLLKLRFSLNYENREFREFDHFYKFNPDGNFHKFQWGYNGSISLDHTLNKTTFYDLKFTQFKKNFEQYVYEDPEDPRYVDNNAPQFTTAAFQFSKGGQQNQHFERTTRTNIGKFNLTSQINKQHLLKAGFEGKLHRLDFLDFNTVDGSQFTADTAFFPFKPDPNRLLPNGQPLGPNPNWTQYLFEPVELSFYAQDKMEYQDFIVNVGIRFDYFDSRGQVLADPLDPDIDNPLLPAHAAMSRAEREKIWYKDAAPKYQVSPRFGLAFPITARGVIHASYGHFLQIPEFQLLYQNPSFRFLNDSKNDHLFGNSDLDAQRSVMYEIGLQQQLSDDIGFDVTAFYRDVRNWVGTSPLQPTYRPDLFYSRYENRDYANVRGATVTLNKRFSNHFSANFSYTGQIAEGNASNPADAFNDEKNNREPRKVLIPLNWDRSHVINGNVYLGLGSFGATLLGRFETGLPYTPQFFQGSRRGANISKGLDENSERRPELITFDLQMSYDLVVNLSGRSTRIGVFAKVFNLLDRKNEQQVFADTGTAEFTLEGGTRGAGADPRFTTRPDFYSAPRRVQVGISYDF